jgi:hypothetical protein
LLRGSAVGLAIDQGGALLERFTGGVAHHTAIKGNGLLWHHFYNNTGRRVQKRDKSLGRWCRAVGVSGEVPVGATSHASFVFGFSEYTLISWPL